jgi:hypothetical protein
VLGAGSHVAATLGVDGATSVLRCELGDMLNELLGRQARKVELQVRAARTHTQDTRHET